MRVGPTTHLLPLARTKHSTINSTIYYKRDNKDNMEGYFIMQLHFHLIPIRKCTIQCKHKILKDSWVSRFGMHRGLALLKEKVMIHGT
jgi:diadenosine tetraphosphate (Ap4A) HIT family hydrolase